MTIELPSGHVLRWLDTVGEAALVDGELVISAGPHSDWFVDPASLQATANAPVLATNVEGDFQLRALVSVGFVARFDAGVLFVHHAGDTYAKLCFELSPAGERTVVSVVTRAVSDDANGPVIDGDDVWLRVSRMGDVLAFHWSADGLRWELLRYFRLGEDVPSLAVGFCTQSPTGDGCTARFSAIEWNSATLADVRDGS